MFRKADIGKVIDGHPIVEGFLSPDSLQVTILCPYCRMNHFHGSAGDDGSGFRVPHCILPGEVKTPASYYIVTTGYGKPPPPQVKAKGKNHGYVVPFKPCVDKWVGRPRGSPP